MSVEKIAEAAKNAAIFASREIKAILINGSPFGRKDSLPPASPQNKSNSFERG
jgi:hypothetical protein